jgi:plasmid replication initiation protein
VSLKFEQIQGAQRKSDEMAGLVAPMISRGVPRVSRDEMNLAEFPLTVLSTRSNPKIKTLEFSDSIKGPAGKPIKREWIITGADKFGLPTSSDDEVLLGLLKLSVDDGLTSAKVYFTRYELLKILNWTTEGRSYTRLQNALDRLSGVRIKATNAFYDNETKSFSTKNFGVIDAYEVNDGRENTNKPSFFIWSDELFRSFQVGFIKKFDLDYYLHLNSAVAKRLYRYLDKLFWYKPRVQFNLFTLCHEKIGVSRNFKYASSLKQQLEPGLEELIKTQFISSYEFIGKGKLTEVVVVSANQPRSVDNSMKRVSTQTADVADAGGDSAGQLKKIEKNQSDPARDNAVELSSNAEQQLIAFLVDRGIQENQAKRLAEKVPADELSHSFAVIEYFDELMRIGSDKVSRSPVGFLYKAIEKGLEFNLPASKEPTSSTSGKAASAKVLHSARLHSARKEVNSARQLRASREQTDILQAEFHTLRSAIIVERIDSIDPQKLIRLRAEVDQQLRPIRAALGEETYQRTREGIVDDRIAEVLDLDTFDDWVRKRSG